MPKLQERVQPQKQLQSQRFSAETLIHLSFRMTLIAIGLALLFVAAIYYGLINP